MRMLPSTAKSRAGKLLLLCAVLSAASQILWFWPKCIHQIDIDAMAYTGIAKEISQGLFGASINGFRSPLISWLIAATGYHNAFAAGKAITLVAYFATLLLLYVFTFRLWHSEIMAGTAALLFTLSRGITFDAVAFISPDFLFMGLTVLYFLVLLQCLQKDRSWFVLGIIHGIAFLAKAFALPWLCVLTLTSIWISDGSPKRKLMRVALALAFPLVAASFWSATLHTKYGVFTTGTQFKSNYLQWVARAYRDHRPSTYAFLTDITATTDDHMVDDPMAPRTWPWSYKLTLHNAIPALLKTQLKNLPLMIKELTILANAGILLCFVLVLISLRRQRTFMKRVEFEISFVACIGVASLIAAYSMLVVDGRYLLPVIPVVIAIASRFLIWNPEVHSSWRIAAWALTLLAVIWSVAYSSSPFRVQRRDFQVTCYQAGRLASQIPGNTIVSIGWGPYPEHGVGWEAGYKAAYFAGKRLIATAERMPTHTELLLLESDLRRAGADTLLLWGKDDAYRRAAVKEIGETYRVSGTILDARDGDIGLVLSHEFSARAINTMGR